MPKFPATDENVPFKSAEAAAAHCKIAALSIIIATLIAYVFWLSLAVLLALTALVFQQPIPALALLASVGLTPLAMAALTYKIAEKIVSIYVAHYVRTYFRVS